MVRIHTFVLTGIYSENIRIIKAHYRAYVNDKNRTFEFYSGLK